MIASIPIDCDFWSTNDGWKGLRKSLSVTIRGSSFEDAKKNMAGELQVHIERILREHPGSGARRNFLRFFSPSLSHQSTATRQFPEISSVIEAEERERYRISVDLHEDIGQRLTMLAIDLEQLRTDTPTQPAGLQDRTDAIRKQTLDILTDVQASAHELHSPRLEYLDIANGHAMFLQRVRRAQESAH